MHEGDFTKQIVDSILEGLKDQTGEILKVTVEAGEMLHLVPESVEEHYRILTKNTALEKAQLNFITIPVQIKCSKCSHVGPVEDHHLLQCQKCDSLDVCLLKGDKVEITEIEAVE